MQKWILGLVVVAAVALLQGGEARSPPYIDAGPPPMDENGRCLYHANWKMDCNTCFCTPGSMPGCTLMGCISQHQVPSYPPSPEPAHA